MLESPSTITRLMTRRQRSILIVATLSQAVATGVSLGAFPLVLTHLEGAFGASRAQISLGPILIMSALAAAGMVAGGVHDKGKIRGAMLFGAGLMTTALLIASWAPSLAVLAIAALLAGASIPFFGPLAGMTLVTRLFVDGQGRAFGIMSMGPALGMGFFAGVVGFLLQTLDWRSVYLLLAGSTLVVVVPVIWLVIPAQIDVPPDRDSIERGEVAIGDALGRPVFWLSALVFALSTGISAGWTNHVAAFLSEVGLGESQVTSLVAAQFWMGVPGALLFGILSDRMPLTRLYLVMLGFEAIAFALYGSGISPLGAAIVGVSFGMVMGGMIPLYMALLGGRLKTEILGRALGLSNLVMLPVMAFTTVSAALIHERQASYEWAAILFSAGIVVAISCLLLSNRSAAKS
jgi:MFS family permease